MHVSVAGIMVSAAVGTAWGLLGLYCWRCTRRRQRWQARWDEFASWQSGLDAELDRAWDFLQR